MYGIYWTKNGCESKLTQAGSDYASLDCYLEDAFMHSWYHCNGYCGTIVRVHMEDGKWMC